MNETVEKRGPGRPSHAEIAARHTYEGDNYLEESPAAMRRRLQNARAPFGAMGQKLAYEPRPGFHRHWTNDTPGNVASRLSGGYEHVKDKEGKPVSAVVGTMEGGGPLIAYLLEIPDEWYEEDMRKQQEEVDRRVEALKRGEANRQEGDGRYVPAQGISIKG
jgi:hypothetical protein